MNDKLPEFLLCKDNNDVSKNTFIINTSKPQFVCRVVKAQENLAELENRIVQKENRVLELIEVFGDIYSVDQVLATMREMLDWLPSQL